MALYTGRGDEGMTDLADMSRVPKTNPRIEAAGAVDELNGLVGTVRPTGYDDLDERLVSVQVHLHVVQADVSNPDSGADAPVVTEEHVNQLETWIDEGEAEVGDLQGFIIPSGGAVGSELHYARSVCRRAERRVIDAVEHGDETGMVLVYLNRLSDALFVFGRVANHRDGFEEREVQY